MHIVTGELRKAPYIKNGVGKDGQSTMFGIELSEVLKDYKTGEKSYTNYKAILFASSDAHIDYYNSVLVEGNFIVLTSDKLKIEISDCGQYTKLFMDNARLENAGYIQQEQNQGAQQQPQQQRQQTPQQRQAQAPKPQNHGHLYGNNQQQPNNDFDDSIPF